MLELAPNQGRNERGEFKLWLVFYRYTFGEPRSSLGHYFVRPRRLPAVGQKEYLNYLLLPWIFRGTPDIEAFDAMGALGAFKGLPDPWNKWTVYRTLLPDDWRVMQWCIATDVHEAAICAAIKRKESRNESIGPAEVRTEAVQVG